MWVIHYLPELLKFHIYHSTSNANVFGELTIKMIKRRMATALLRECGCSCHILVAIMWRDKSPEHLRKHTRTPKERNFWPNLRSFESMERVVIGIKNHNGFLLCYSLLLRLWTNFLLALMSLNSNFVFVVVLSALVIWSPACDRMKWTACTVLCYALGYSQYTVLSRVLTKNEKK